MPLSDAARIRVLIDWEAMRLQSQTESSLVWQVPATSVRVLLDRPVAADLRARLEESGGHEFGGLLLGESKPSGEGVVTRVVAFEPFPIEENTGSHYALSTRDRQRLQTRLKRRQRNGPAPVGFCRSHLRRGLYLDQRDFELFRAFFPSPEAVFLLVHRPDGVGPASGGFFVWEGEDVRRHECYLEISLEGEAAGGIQKAPAPVRPAAPVRLAPPRRLTGRRGLPAAILVAAAALSIGLFWAGRRNVPAARPAVSPSRTETVRPTPATTAPIDVRIRQSGGELELLWDGASPAIASADHGQIMLGDAGKHYQVLLNRAGLGAGRYLYRPKGDTVTARLEVFQMVQGRETAATVVRPEPETRTEAKPVEPAKARPAPREPRKGAADRTVQAARLLPIPAPPVAAAPEFVPEPPSLQVGSIPQAPGHFGPAPASPGPVVLVAIESAPPSRVRQVLRRVPGVRGLAERRRPESFVAARPLHRRMPQALPDMPGGEDAMVEVVVHVDETGKVSDVSPRGGDRRLSRLAREAVIDWIFAPARVDGAPVASDILLRFAFRNSR